MATHLQPHRLLARTRPPAIAADFRIEGGKLRRHQIRIRARSLDEVDETARAVRQQDPDGFGKMQRDWLIKAIRAAIADVVAAAHPAKDGAPIDENELKKLQQESEQMGDLQHVSSAALQVAKAKMDVAYEAQRLRPGDPGYVYDKREDFEPPTEDNEWDEEEEDEEEDSSTGEEGGVDGKKDGGMDGSEGGRTPAEEGAVHDSAVRVAPAALSPTGAGSVPGSGSLGNSAGGGVTVGRTLPPSTVGAFGSSLGRAGGTSSSGSGGVGGGSGGALGQGVDVSFSDDDEAEEAGAVREGRQGPGAGNGGAGARNSGLGLGLGASSSGAGAFSRRGVTSDRAPETAKASAGGESGFDFGDSESEVESEVDEEEAVDGGMEVGGEGGSGAGSGAGGMGGDADDDDLDADDLF